MIIYLVGISCIGKTTIGKLIAEYIDFDFCDFDEQIENFYKKPIELIQDEFITSNGFRKKASVVLAKLFDIDRNIVIASTSSGFRDYYLRKYKQIKKSKKIVSINLTDKPENILNRLTFYDRTSIHIEKNLSENDKKEYLKDIKKDITFFKKFNLRADYQINIAGIELKDIAKKITDFLTERDEIIESKRNSIV